MVTQLNKFDYSIYYSQFHEGTESHRAKVSTWLEPIIKPHLDMSRDARILDVGCGFGNALYALKRLGYDNVMGVEVSNEQADVCRQAGFTVEVVEDSIAWLVNHPNQFDFIILFDVLEHVRVENQIDFLRALYTALKSGGKLLLTVPNANSILNSRWRYNDYTHHSSFTEHSLRFVLLNSGFKNLWIDSKKGIDRFPRRFWRSSFLPAARKWVVRWCWLQVFKAEIPWENINDICFELNLTATAKKND